MRVVPTDEVALHIRTPDGSVQEPYKVCTCTMESHSRMFARNLLPKPSPVLAPFTKPAISTNSMLVGTSFLDFDKSLSICKSKCFVCTGLAEAEQIKSKVTLTCNLSSGTATTPTLGSIVQNGKLAA